MEAEVAAESSHNMRDFYFEQRIKDSKLDRNKQKQPKLINI